MSSEEIVEVEVNSVELGPWHAVVSAVVQNGHNKVLFLVNLMSEVDLDLVDASAVGPHSSDEGPVEVVPLVLQLVVSAVLEDYQ